VNRTIPAGRLAASISASFVTFQPRVKTGAKISVLRNKEFYCSASLRASQSHVIDSIHLGSTGPGRSAEECRPNLKVDPRPI